MTLPEQPPFSERESLKKQIEHANRLDRWARDELLISLCIVNVSSTIKKYAAARNNLQRAHLDAPTFLEWQARTSDRYDRVIADQWLLERFGQVFGLPSNRFDARREIGFVWEPRLEDILGKLNTLLTREGLPEAELLKEGIGRTFVFSIQFKH